LLNFRGYYQFKQPQVAATAAAKATAGRHSSNSHNSRNGINGSGSCGSSCDHVGSISEAQFGCAPNENHAATLHCCC